MGAIAHRIGVRWLWLPRPVRDTAAAAPVARALSRSMVEQAGAQALYFRAQAYKPTEAEENPDGSP
jgi:hypothetical protein